MAGIKRVEKSEFMGIVFINLNNCNRMWGNEYLLMDSNTFMGGTGGSAYESVIEMFVKIRNENSWQWA